MKRKLEEESSNQGCDKSLETDNFTSDEELLLRPTKRMNMYYNTPRQFKDEKKRILKISKRKLKQIDEPEADLLRSVLINNTFRRLKSEFREEKKSKLKFERSYSPKPSPLASKTVSVDKGTVESKIYYQSAKQTNESRGRVKDGKCKTSMHEITEQSDCEIQVPPYKQSSCQYNKQKIDQDDSVAMETCETHSDTTVLEMHTSDTPQSIVTVECNKNNKRDIEDSISSQMRMDVEITASHVSKEEVCESTQSNPRVNTDICQVISNRDSELLMDTSLQSDNEEIDVCTCTDEQTVLQTDEQRRVLPPSPSHNALSVIANIQLDKRDIKDNQARQHKSLTRNSCLAANKDSCYSQGVHSKTNMLNATNTQRTNIDIATLNAVYPWLAANRAPLTQRSPLSIDEVINYSYIDSGNRSSNGNQKMREKYSNLQFSRMPMPAFGTSHSLPTANLAVPSFHFSNASEPLRHSQGLYFLSLSHCHYFPSFLSSQPALLGLRTVNNAERHKESPHFPSSPLISCNSLRHPITSDMMTFRDTQRLTPLTDMVACT